MQINFATKNRSTALGYIKKALPDHVIDEETAKPVLDLVEQDHIRVGDPLMYGTRIPIYPSANYQPEDANTLNNWMRSLKDSK